MKFLSWAPSLPYANLTTQARGVLRAWAKATAKKCCDWGIPHLMNMSENVHRFSLVHCSINLPFWESNYHHSSTQLWRKIKSGKLKRLNEEQSITLCMICASCITSETDVVRNLAIWFAVLILLWTLLMFWIETLVYRVCHSIIFRLTFILLVQVWYGQLLHVASSWVGFGNNLRSSLVKACQAHDIRPIFRTEWNWHVVHIYLYILYNIICECHRYIYIYELTCSRERGGTVWHNGCPLVLACALAWRATYMT